MGLAVTAYGWVGALAALLSGAMPTRISRKALLVGLMLIPRAFLPRCNPVLFDVRPDERPHDWRPGAWRLLGLNWHCRRAAGAAAPAGASHGDHFGGVSAASVVGVPLASFIATLAGWRLAFVSMALLSP